MDILASTFNFDFEQRYHEESWKVECIHCGTKFSNSTFHVKFTKVENQHLCPDCTESYLYKLIESLENEIEIYRNNGWVKRPHWLEKAKL